MGWLTCLAFYNRGYNFDILKLTISQHLILAHILNRSILSVIIPKMSTLVNNDFDFENMKSL